MAEAIRWEATYTRQKTKKRKTYQDGWIVCKQARALASNQRKASLLDEAGQVLEEKFLSRIETIEPGGSLEFECYLVDIGNVAETRSIQVSQIITKLRKPPKTKEEEAQGVLLKSDMEFEEHTLEDGGRARDLQLPDSASNENKSNFIAISKAKFTGSMRKADNGFRAPLQSAAYGTEENLKFQPDACPRKHRDVTIPNSFQSMHAYKYTMLGAVIEELNLVLQDFASNFQEGITKVTARVCGTRPHCVHGPAQLHIVKKEGNNKGRFFYRCPSRIVSCTFAWADEGSGGEQLSDEELQQALSYYNLHFYSDCEIFSRNTAKQWDSTKKRTGKCHKTEYGDEEVMYANKRTSTYLKLGRLDKSCCHSRGDLWIISSKRSFLKESRDDFVIVAVSEYHGPSSARVLEIRILGQKPVAESLNKIYALHGPCVQSELAMLDVIRNMTAYSMPLLPLLMQFPKEPCRVSSEDNIHEMTNGFISRFRLNEDQAEVLCRIGIWFLASSISKSGHLLSKEDICLVHGTFGSGKSFLLVVIILFIMDILKNDKETRILVSAATNTAVDRILIGLLDQGFNDFTRVGNTKKIAKDILPFSVHAASGEDCGEGEILRDIEDNLQETSGILNRERMYTKDDPWSFQKAILKKVKVVGVTCFSSTNEILKGNKFKVCLLDECSQIPEPLSLLPLSHFSCEKLVAVGDPAQLPPVLFRGTESEIEVERNPETAEIHLEENDNRREIKPVSADLTRALFVRLVAMGYEPVLLRTQYRCHPRLIVMPNQLFYDGRLINGCSEIDRPPLLHGLPPFLFYDTLDYGNEFKDLFKSYSNIYEANLACMVIQTLVKQGIPSQQIGVIVFYKSQASLVLDLVNQRCEKQFTRISTCETGSKQQAHDSLKSLPGKRHNITQGIQISTVDAFQGMEKNIIILSCCRTNGLGFVASPNRLNVALTRARHHLIILGKASNLKGSFHWNKLLESSFSTPGSYLDDPAAFFYHLGEDTWTQEILNKKLHGISNPHLPADIAPDLPAHGEALKPELQVACLRSACKIIQDAGSIESSPYSTCKTGCLQGILHDDKDKENRAPKPVESQENHKSTGSIDADVTMAMPETIDTFSTGKSDIFPTDAVNNLMVSAPTTKTVTEEHECWMPSFSLGC